MNKKEYQKIKDDYEAKINEDYNVAIAEADVAMNGKDYTKAKESYTKASQLKSYEEYPKQKLTEIEGLLADLAKQDEAYNAAIAEADNFFSAEDYEKAAHIRDEISKRN